MQLFPNALDLPDALLRAHEEGKLVFFCGAGVSYPAKLKGFDWLVDELYRALHTELQGEEACAYKDQDFDIAVAQLEQRVPGGRKRVRQALFEILQPNITAPAALATHRALLKLSRTRAGDVRLVTTNFDRLFLLAGEAGQHEQDVYSAPLLPLPKTDWRGLIHLHGLLPETADDRALDRLVLTSADFGLAYLVEGWASRFITELFRRHTVCFVGYSINDKVMRYMLDAFAAERQRGETLGEAFVFAAYDSDDEASPAERAWRSKNVVPILYPSHNAHAALHGFLQHWADHHAAGAEGRRALLDRYALQHPPADGSDDGCIGRVLWALDEPTGQIAAHFAELDPAPPASWIAPLARHGFSHANGRSFEDWLASDRPLDFGEQARPIFDALSRWALRHCEHPELLLWIGQRSVRNPWFLHDVEHLLQPQRAPRTPSIRTFWSLLLAGRIGTANRIRALTLPLDARLHQHGLDAGLRFSLRQKLQPHIHVKPALPRISDEAAAPDNDDHDPTHGAVDFALVFGDEYLQTAVELRDELPALEQHLPELLPDFDALLVDALALMDATGLAGSGWDRSEWHQPSISTHAQNFGYRPWTVLIELTRDAWCALIDRDPVAAKRWPSIWLARPYPVFKRLALYAIASEPKLFGTDVAVDALLDNGAHCLWHPALKRETLRLLHALGSLLSRRCAARKRLEDTIIIGARATSGTPTDDEWNERCTLHRLIKLASGGKPLGPLAARTLKAMEQRHPDLCQEADERDEFCLWLYDGDKAWDRQPTPEGPAALAQWLRDNPQCRGLQMDDFAARCNKTPQVVAAALQILANENDWSATERWQTALQTWAAEDHAAWSWKSIAPLLHNASPAFIDATAHALAWWLRYIPAALDQPDERFFTIYDRIQQARYNTPIPVDDDRLHVASNSTTGLAAQALLDAAMRWSPEGQGVYETCRQRLTELCAASEPSFRAARAIIAERTGWLYRTEPAWTAKQLLPLFNWEKYPDEAPGVWQGFCMAPPYDWALVSALKGSILATTGQLDKLGPMSETFIFWFTFLALEPNGPLSPAELRVATHKLDDPALLWTAQALTRAMRSAGAEAAACWHSRLKPYLRYVWPQHTGRNRPAIAKQMAKICALAGEAKDDAYEELKSWLSHSKQFNNYLNN